MLYAAGGRTTEGDYLLAGDDWVAMAMILIGSLTFAVYAYRMILKPLTSLPPDPAVTHEPVDRRRLALVSAVSVVVIGATGLTAYACGGDRPARTRVLGVDLGGRSRTDAERICTTISTPAPANRSRSSSVTGACR